MKCKRECNPTQNQTASKQTQLPFYIIKISMRAATQPRSSRSRTNCALLSVFLLALLLEELVKGKGLLFLLQHADVAGLGDGSRSLPDVSEEEYTRSQQDSTRLRYPIVWAAPFFSNSGV